jgi:hypothetical protein
LKRIASTPIKLLLMPRFFSAAIPDSRILSAFSSPVFSRRSADNIRCMLTHGGKRRSVGTRLLFPKTKSL